MEHLQGHTGLTPTRLREILQWFDYQDPKRCAGQYDKNQGSSSRRIIRDHVQGGISKRIIISGVKDNKRDGTMQQK